MKQPLHGDVRVMTVTITAQPEKRAELTQALVPLLAEVRALEHCLECIVGQALEGQPRFLVHLVWANAAAMDAYLASESFHILLGASSTLAGPTALCLNTGMALGARMTELPPQFQAFPSF